MSFLLNTDRNSRHRHIERLVAVGLTAALLLLTGCSDFVDQDQPTHAPKMRTALEPDLPVGQTFVARHAGLNGVEVWLEAGEGNSGTLTLHLRSEPQAEDDIATATLSLAQVTAPGFYSFSFSPLRESHSRYYYAFLAVDEAAEVQVGVGPGEAYLDGALYRDHEPQDAQAAFRLVYGLQWMILDLAQASIRGLGLLIVAGLLYVVPGWALLAWLWHERLSWAEKLGLAVGLSLAPYPLLLLWTDLAGLHLGSLYAWIPVIAGLAALIWKYRGWQPRTGWQKLRQWARSEMLWPDLALLAVLALVFAVRLLVVRTLDAPMWGDSYQHTMIAQLLVDNGGLFDSWEPYAELQSLTYHFGFHSAMAALHWVTGMAMHKAVLWGAQVLNGLAVLALYPLALRVSGNRWAGVGAVLAAGLLSPMPMTYVNWGRYTQLAGQVILPAAVLISWHAFEALDCDWQLIALGWIAVGGLALTHYRMLIFYIIFVLAWVLLSLHRAAWRRDLARVVLAGAGAALLFLPWFVHIFGGNILRNLGRQLTTAPSQVSSFTRQYNAIGDLTDYMAPALWLLLIAAVAVGLWRRKRGVLLVAAWWFLLFIATNPRLLSLPGSGAISNFALFIAIYILAGVSLGYTGGQVMSRLRSWRPAGFLVSLLVVVVGLSGVRARMRDVDTAAHMMVTRPDLRAMTWIQENTPEDAKFLVNSFFAYGGSVVVGSDGGWWLPLLAGRANMVPPLNYGTEQGPRPDYREWVNEVTGQIQEAGIDDPATLALLEERGVTHVYIGQQQGRVNYGGPHVLDPKAMEQSGRYRTAYHRDRVWVFEVKQ